MSKMADEALLMSSRLGRSSNMFFSFTRHHVCSNAHCCTWSQTIKLLSVEKRKLTVWFLEWETFPERYACFEWSLVYLPLTLIFGVLWTSQPVLPQRLGCLSVMQFDLLLMMSWHLLSGALHLDSWHLIGSDRTAPVAHSAQCLPGKC